MPDDEDPQTIAEQTSKEVQPPDPYIEPPNSTVDDWFGQRVERDTERATADQSANMHRTGEQQARENADNDPPA
jgi:hypothetical protein